VLAGVLCVDLDEAGPRVAVLVGIAELRQMLHAHPARQLAERIDALCCHPARPRRAALVGEERQVMLLPPTPPRPVSSSYSGTSTMPCQGIPPELQRWP